MNVLNYLLYKFIPLSTTDNSPHLIEEENGPNDEKHSGPLYF